MRSAVRFAAMLPASSAVAITVPLGVEPCAHRVQRPMMAHEPAPRHMRCAPWRAFSDISTMRARLCCQGLRNGHRLHEADHRQQQGRHQQLLPQAKVNDRHRQRGLAPRYVADHLYALVFQVEGEDGEGGEMPEIFGRRRSNSETS